jgi:hypothetical protein
MMLMRANQKRNGDTRIGRDRLGRVNGPGEDVVIDGCVTGRRGSPPLPLNHPLSSCRAITMRWIWFVPSQIWVIFAWWSA